MRSSVLSEKWLLRRIGFVAVLATGVMFANPFLVKLAFDIYVTTIPQAAMWGAGYIVVGSALEAATKLFHSSSFLKLMARASVSTHDVATDRRVESRAQDFERVSEADMQAVEADMEHVRVLAGSGDRRSFNTARLLATGLSLLFISPLSFGFFVVAGSIQWVLLAHRLKKFRGLGPEDNAARSEVNWLSRDLMSRASIRTVQNMLIAPSVKDRAHRIFGNFMGVNIRGWKIQQGMEALTLLGMGVIAGGVFLGGWITGAPIVALAAASAFVLKSTALLGQLVIDQAAAQQSIRASERIARVCGFPIERVAENHFSRVLKRVFAVGVKQADLPADKEEIPERRSGGIYIDPSQVTGYALRDVTTPRNDSRKCSLPIRYGIMRGVLDLGIIGESASGKTVLANVIAGQLRPYSGRVEVLTATGCYDLAQLSDRAVDENVLYIGRDTKLTLPKDIEGVNFEIVAEKLRRTGFDEEKIEQIKKGDTKLHLSSGQERRVLLAVMTERPEPPSLLILDEPESGIDPVHWSDVEDLTTRKTDNARPMKIVITHIPQMLDLVHGDAALGENVLLLDKDGGVVEMAFAGMLKNTRPPSSLVQEWIVKARGPNSRYLVDDPNSRYIHRTGGGTELG